VGTFGFGDVLQPVVQAPADGQTVSYSPVFTGGLVGAARP
jgi:hypothetical protein